MNFTVQLQSYSRLIPKVGDAVYIEPPRAETRGEILEVGNGLVRMKWDDGCISSLVRTRLQWAGDGAVGERRRSIWVVNP